MVNVITLYWLSYRDIGYLIGNNNNQHSVKNRAISLTGKRTEFWMGGLKSLAVIKVSR